LDTPSFTTLTSAIAQLRPGDSSLLEWLKRLKLERKLALVLTVLAVISGITTYVMISTAPPSGRSVQTVVLLLNIDLILLLLLGVVVARRLVKLVLQRRQGLAGSKLHGRLVALFAVIAVLPAIVVSVFSVLFLSSGLETWFGDRIRTALDNSLSVAEAYLEEHKENIRADALAMAADLNRQGPLLVGDPELLQQFVAGQAAVRNLTEAIVFDRLGNVLARTGLSFGLEAEYLPPETLSRVEAGEVVTVTSSAEDRVRALVSLFGFGEAYLFVGRFIDAQVLGYMQQTQRVVSEYQELQTERGRIQFTSAALFGLVALLLLLAATWTGMAVADRLIAPIGQLINAADRVRTGDLMVRVSEGPSDDEIAVLSRAFNRMATQLQNQRSELIEANQQLDGRRRFTEAVLSGVTAGVIGLDADRRIILPNRAASRFLQPPGGGQPTPQADGTDLEPADAGFASEEIIGADIATVLPETARLFDLPELAQGQSVQAQVRVNRAGIEYTLLVRLAAQREGPGEVGGDGTAADGREAEQIVGYVLTFDDITRLLSAQRQAAWAEVARRIAHEIKNPLTPIQLSAERLGRKFASQIQESDRSSFGRSIDTIIRQVDVIGRLIREFSAFARMPDARMRPEPLAELVHHAVELQESAWPGLTIEVQLEDVADIYLDCDAEKISQALNNLLQNAAQAMMEGRAATDAPAPADGDRGGIDGGDRSAAAAEGDGPARPPVISVVITRKEHELDLDVADNGPGFPPGERQRFLEPYVTTKAKGTGLGLAIVHKIMEEHSGRVELDQSATGGALVRLVFPAERIVKNRQRRGSAERFDPGHRQSFSSGQ
jgi:two-component system nitrogen regulation sensor histidine kinase NtrY